MIPNHALRFAAILLLCSSVTAQNPLEMKRTVTEHQLMHDKGRAREGLKRLLWLHGAMKGVHTATRRDHTTVQQRTPLVNRSGTQLIANNTRDWKAVQLLHLNHATIPPRTNPDPQSWGYALRWKMQALAALRGESQRFI
uniref:Parathyroid hormone 2 n=1 Tax=Callorhinchus milii TaxID=7868 RepID=D8X184_CALMI|nr:parathyroid hormone 2 [Callorhinchus milii]